MATLSNSSHQIEQRRLPHHVAIIMDGNGRWAKSKGLPRVAGHKRGGDVLKDIVRHAGERGIGHLSVYAFSTENWSRPSAEINALFNLLVEFCHSQVDELVANQTRLKFIGDLAGMPDRQLSAMRFAERQTAGGRGLQFNVCINYGGRQEIVQAIKQLVEQDLAVDQIDVDAVGANLYTAGIPDPDLIIRTSGEQRLSNFFAWQSAYSEFVFVDDHWPAFTRRHFDECIATFSRRRRRFGGLEES